MKIKISFSVFTRSTKICSITCTKQQNNNKNQSNFLQNLQTSFSSVLLSLLQLSCLETIQTNSPQCQVIIVTKIFFQHDSIPFKNQAKSKLIQISQNEFSFQWNTSLRFQPRLEVLRDHPWTNRTKK